MSDTRWPPEVRLATRALPVDRSAGSSPRLSRKWPRWLVANCASYPRLSRTSFAERFRSVVGMPPLTYLSRWRMLLAQRALRDGDVRVGALAADLGYASDSAFSTAFNREVGVSPLRYRQQAHRRAAAETGAGDGVFARPDLDR